MTLRVMRRAHTLLLLMIAYGAASLLHFAHNAVAGFPGRSDLS
jgi:hypothetical protein